MSKGKAPLHRLPAGALGAVAGAIEYGDNKYQPGDLEASGESVEEWIGAALRHLHAAGRDPLAIDEESRLTHLALAGARVLGALERAGIQYAPAGPRKCEVCGGSGRRSLGLKVVEDATGDAHTCPYCFGKGHR